MDTGRGSVFRAFCLILGFGAGLSATADTAYGQSQACRNLAAELKMAGRGSSGAQARKLQNAIAQQNVQLGKVRAQIRQAQCGFGIFSNNVAHCATLRKSAASMENNIWKLQMRLDRSGRPGSGRDRNRILASMRANGCNQKPAVKTVSAPAGAGKAARRAQEAASPLRRSGDVYQTMCVRTCDGYYFPISFSVSKDMFDRDQKTCQARCPGAEVALYAHDVLKEESEDMVSVATGTPYRDLPKAFSYRLNGVSKKVCGCQPSRNFSVVAGEAPVDDSLATGSAGAQPAPEETPSADGNAPAGGSFHVVPTPRPSPDMVASATLETEAPPEQEVTPVAPAASSEPRRVRIVGPEFLPDPEEAIDLRAPAQHRAR
ncbi:DUF2865 domain-containing protein [Nitratireductor pacificus]|uniref:DUF2865 domain-containing protein n=1 Tax=Nitratireductor pacificus pht-3B TaxID=391937 RepID=K2N110_9HYPH|nr:DUF2865 domain-containing protein [Nitratireductor pacificus]EKF17943.1 hypothetical protein NA2_15794 [Nitratireductor pacificus pht-3B]